VCAGINWGAYNLSHLSWLKFFELVAANEKNTMESNPTAIDWPDFEARCLHDAEFIREMLEIFVKIAPQTLVTLQAAVAAGDWPTARRHAHTLKGSAANLSAHALRDHAADAEFAADNADEQSVIAKLPLISFALDASLANIAENRARFG